MLGASTVACLTGLMISAGIGLMLTNGELDEVDDQK
jgi:hypothetical protein